MSNPLVPPQSNNNALDPVVTTEGDATGSAATVSAQLTTDPAVLPALPATTAPPETQTAMPGTSIAIEGALQHSTQSTVEHLEPSTLPSTGNALPAILPAELAPAPPVATGSPAGAPVDVPATIQGPRDLSPTETISSPYPLRNRTQPNGATACNAVGVSQQTPVQNSNTLLFIRLQYSARRRTQ
jgi:hypothetical protein